MAFKCCTYLTFLNNSIYQLLSEEVFCDVCIIANDGSKLYAHSLILAAVSSQFKTDFNKFKNSENNNLFSLQMINFDPEILKHIICFMYTGCLNVPPTVSPDQILLAGIKLGLDKKWLLHITSAKDDIEKDNKLCNDSQLMSVSLNQNAIFDHIYSRNPFEHSFISKPIEEQEESDILSPSCASSENVQSFSNNVKNIDATCSSEEIMISEVVNYSCILHEKNMDGSIEETVTETDAFSHVEKSQVTVKEKKLTRGKTVMFCHQCGRLFKRNKDYEEHQRTHTGEKPFCCEICSKAFSRERTLVVHRLSHTKMNLHGCQDCGKKFATLTRLKCHKRLHTGEKPYKCNTCLKTFLRRNELTDHKRLHEGGNTCDICGKQFTRLQNLREHIAGAHANKKPFRCDLCYKNFSYSSTLRNHMKTHQINKSNTCSICKKVFRKALELSSHVEKAHDAQYIEIEIYN